MISFNTKIYWKFEEEKIINPLSDKSVYYFKGHYNHKMLGIFNMLLRVNKSVIPKAVNLDKFGSKVPFECKHVKTAHRQTGFDKWKAFVKKNNLFY